MRSEYANLEVRVLALFFAFLAAGSPVFAQRQIDTRPPPLSLDEGLRQGRALVADLLARRPAEDTTNSGILRIRDDNGGERTVPIRFTVFSTPSNWVSLFESCPTQAGSGRETLTVIHRGQGLTEYLFSERTAEAGRNEPVARRVGEQTMAPFAASDFWLADLGLQFLDWPQQRVLRKEMRHSQPCDVLESTGPSTGSAGYCRVVSWVDAENGGIIHADAYDAKGRLLKQFDPKTLKRVRGQPQLQEIEMRNVQTGSRTWIRFDL
jgi:Outer membrane lipoprotein-sorting protein